MYSIDAEIEKNESTFSASIPEDVLDRAEQARDIFGQYDIPKEELTTDICRKIVDQELEGIFAIHWGTEMFGKSPTSVKSPWSHYETGAGLPEEEPEFPDFDEKDLHVHAIEYHFNVDNDYVEAETSRSEYRYLIPDEYHGKPLPSKKYGYKVTTDWDGTIAFNMYHPGGHPQVTSFMAETAGYPDTIAVISEREADEYR